MGWQFCSEDKYIAPFEFDLIYNIIEIYDECVKEPGIMIKDPNLSKQVGDIMDSLVKLVKDIVISGMYNFIIVIIW